VFFLGTGDINAPVGAAPHAQESPAVQDTWQSEMENSLPPDIHDPLSPLVPLTPLDKPFIVQENDTELNTLQRILKELHARFYQLVQEYDVSLPDVSAHPDLDVKVRLMMSICFIFQRILPDLKKKVLAGVHVAFSGLIPLGSRPELYAFYLYNGSDLSVDPSCGRRRKCLAQNATTRSPRR
jgi:RNA polymerase II subunit A-like phosphatase